MKRIPEILSLLLLLSQPVLAAESQPSPMPSPALPPSASSGDPITVYRLEAYSPEFLSLSQVAYPLGLGYFLQGENELGGLYMALQGSMMLAGTLWGAGMNGSSWTQLLPNLGLGLWLVSLTHVDTLARDKNAQLAQSLGLSPDQVHRLMGSYPFDPKPVSLPLPRWEPKLAAAVFLSGSGQITLAPGPGLQMQYPLGSWLKVYTGESWLGQLVLNLDIQGFWPVWTSGSVPAGSVASSSGSEMTSNPNQEAKGNIAQAAPDLLQAPGFSSSLGLVYRTPTAPWSWYFGGGWMTLWRTEMFTKSGSAQASWQGVNALAGVSFRQPDRVSLNLGLELGFLSFNGSTGSMSELPALIRLQPYVSGSFQF